MSGFDWEVWTQLLVSGLALVTATYVVVYHLLHLLMITGAIFEVRQQRREIPPMARKLAVQTGEMPGISIIIPAFNEQVSIVQTVRSALAQQYPDFEVLVVNDGSTDHTLEVLWREFDLVPTNERPEPALDTQMERATFVSRCDHRLRVIDKRNGGKADALNMGINWSTRDLICAIDADLLLERDTLVQLAMPMLCDHEVVATGGMIRPLNGCVVKNGKVVDLALPGSWIERFQVLEYLRAFNIGRLFFNRFNAHLIVSGALGLFQRPLLLAIGGYQVQAIGEDMELVVRLQRHLRDTAQAGKVLFVADAICWTELPQDQRELGGQRTRWHQGLLTTLRLHRGIILRRRYGSVGLLAGPYFVAFELLSPFMEIFGWIFLPMASAVGVLDWQEVLPFFLSASVLSILVSNAALLVEILSFPYFKSLRLRFQLLGLALVEPFGYHQLMLWFRLRAFIRYYRTIHVRGGWRPPKRLARQSPPREA